MEIAKQYTGQILDTDAVDQFKDALRHPNMSFNIKPFPVNESDNNAFIKCMDDKSAQAHCPERWKAMQVWIANTVKVSRLEVRMRDLHNIAKSFIICGIGRLLLTLLLKARDHTTHK